MTTSSEKIDRRAKRTVRLLKQAFLEAVEEKGFDAVTIQDITDRADVNRGTFYAHFADKYELMDLLIREKLKRLLDEGLSTSTPGWTRHNLETVIRVVFTHFEQVYRDCRRKESLNPMLEQAVQQELAALFLQWLQNAQNAQTAGAASPLPSQTLASMISWAIFGVANEWGRMRKGVPSEDTFTQILAVIEQGIAPLLPGEPH